MSYQAPSASGKKDLSTIDTLEMLLKLENKLQQMQEVAEASEPAVGRQTHIGQTNHHSICRSTISREGSVSPLGPPKTR